MNKKKPESEQSTLPLAGFSLPQNTLPSEEHKATPMIAQFLEIKETAPDALLFYRMGDFYELFFEDALIAAKILAITLTKRGQYQGKDIPMCGVPVHSHESYLHKLIAAGRKIAICEQLENPAEAKKRGAKSVVKRGIIRIITPGTITEDNLLNAKSHNYLCAIFEERGKIAASWMDISTGDFYAKEIDAINLLSFLHQIDSGEILLPEDKKVLFQNIIREFPKSVHFLPASQFDYKNAEKSLGDFFDCYDISNLGDFSECEIISAGGLLNYVKLMQINKMPHIKRIQKSSSKDFMEIDFATRRNLEICTSLHGTQNTLLKNIDNAKSAGGGRLMKEWLNAPLYNLAKITARHDGVEFALANPKTPEIIALLQSHGDTERALNRLNLERASPRDMKIIGDTLALSITVKSILAKFLSDAPQMGRDIFENLHALSQLLEMLNNALEDELPAIIKDSFFIRQGFSAALDHLKTLTSDGKRVLLALEAKYRKKTGVDSLKIKQNNVLGTFIETPSKHSQKLDTDFIHRQSTANTARFTTNELEECARDIMQAKEKALALELEIFEKLRTEICTKNNEILDIARALSTLDVITSHAEFIGHSPDIFSRPVLDESRRLEIIKGRHLVIERLEEKNNKKFIANDCTLDDDNFLWLITGPNMAGKSTFLRQNALIIILAQAGFYVPAERVHLGLVDKLFSRVGASDDIAKGHSTFMVEMLETSVILNRSTEKSFVILDEIGRGTATFDGLSLAHAIVEYLHDVLCTRTLFATHYHELSKLQESCRNIHLAHVRVREHQNDILFTYEIATGAVSRSYGIHVAKLAAIPQQILNRAAHILEMLEQQQADKNVSFDAADFSIGVQNNGLTSEAVTFLKEINPDKLSPREALDCLYRLKEL